MRGSRVLFAAVFVVAGCKPAPGAGPPSSTGPATTCTPLKVTADGELVAGLEAGDAQLQQSMDSSGVSSTFYELALSRYHHTCGPEMLVETWADDDPQITIGFDTAGKGFVTIAQIRADADVKPRGPMPAPGQPLDLCVHSAPTKAAGGSLAGRTLQVTGRVRVTYCGTRSELMKKHGTGYLHPGSV